MYNSHLDIGGQIISVNAESEQLDQWVCRTFSLASGPGEKETDLHIEIHANYGVPFKDFEVDITSDEQYVWYKRPDYMLQVDRAYTQATIFVHDSFALKHALMNLYSAFIVHREAGLLIHSSCVVEGGDAFLFCGRSGAGKSTVARLSAPRLLLSNEATIVRIHDFGVTAHNSFPFRSDPGTFMEGSCPLKGIHFLQQATQNHRVRISTAEAMMQLMDKVFFWAHDPSETAKIARMLKRLVDEVPSYNLFFQKNDGFWREIS